MVSPKNNQAPKKGNTWVPRPSEGFARAGPSTGPKPDPLDRYRSTTPLKRKSGANTTGNGPPSKKKRKVGETSAAALEVLDLFREDSTRPICGKGKPVTIKNRSQSALILLRPVNDTWADGDEEAMKMIRNINVNLELPCQAPRLRIEMKGYTIELYAHNFLLNEVDPTAPDGDRMSKGCKFTNTRYNQSFIGIQDGFAKELNIPDLSEDHAKFLLEFGGADM